MNGRDPALDQLGSHLRSALARRGARRRGRRLAAVTASAVGLMFSTVAAASDDLGLHTFGLDPARFEFLGGGRPESGAEFVYARNRETGQTEVFLHTSDDGLDRYHAFLLHQRAARAAGTASSAPAVEPGGADCTADELTRAEVAALEALAASFAPGAIRPGRDGPAAHGPALALARQAVRDAGLSCSGHGYGAEIALLVYGLVEPVENLMPGARGTGTRVLSR